MQRTSILSHTSRVRFGMSRADITPPVGIYHRTWGAARHDRATGVHRLMKGDVLVFEALDLPGPESRMIRVQLDLVGLVQDDHNALVKAVSDAGDIPCDRIVITYSHTHAGGWFVPDRFDLPGVELIRPYLDGLGEKLQIACREAIDLLQEVTITYAAGRCDMAANRDGWDEEFGGYVCGYNPDTPVENTVVVGRVVDEYGLLNQVFVHYACHPTTLAWQNTLLSPDFVGALREEVELYTGAPCTYLQGPCGDLGPRDGQQGETAVADRNGRQLAFAALSTLEAMGPPEHDFQYTGPVISGATLGAWAHVPFTDERHAQSTQYGGGTFTVDLPLRPQPDRATLEQELADWNERQEKADAEGDVVAARDYGARAERARRWLGRLEDFPPGETYPLPCSVYRMGDAVWVTCGGEPYSLLQTELRRRFPDVAIFISPLDGGIHVAYLLPADRYGQGLYQEEPSILAQGCLERLIDRLAERIDEVLKASNKTTF